MEKKKIFVSAYACEPDKGSEIGVGWHWIMEMSRQYDLWVLTRKSNQLNIEKWMKRNPDDRNITFIYYDLPSWMRRWKKGLRGVRVYYCLWQIGSNRFVKKTMQKNHIEIYHLLTYGNALWPASRYGMKRHFIWGPVGGTDTIPTMFSKHYDIKSRLIEWTRRMVVKLLPLNVGFRKRCKNADVILCKSENMIENILPKYRGKAVLFTDVAVDEKKLSVCNQNSQKNETYQADRVKYLAVGRLDAWRGFDLLIEAFGKAVRKNKNIYLEILGTGRWKSKLQRMVEQYGLTDNVILAGQVSEKEYLNRLGQADVVINPALKEGGVTVAFDSLGAARPLICIDTGGYTKSMGGNAIVIDRNSRKQIIGGLTEAIIRTTDRKERDAMCENAERLAERYTWREKGKAITHIVERMEKSG